MTWRLTEPLPLQRHFSALPKFAHVESRFCGRKRREKALFDVPINPCVRDTCSKSVAVRLLGSFHECQHGSPWPSWRPRTLATCEVVRKRHGTPRQREGGNAH